MLYRLLISCLFFCSAHAWLDDVCEFLQQYQRDVTVMIIGSISKLQHDILQNSFVYKDSTLVIWDTNKEQDSSFLLQKNVLLLRSSCTEEKLRHFAECEHVDLLVIPDSHVLLFDAAKLLYWLTVASSYVFINGDDIVKSIKEKKYYHTYTYYNQGEGSLCVSLNAARKTLRRHYWIVLKQKRLHDVLSSFFEKKVYSKVRKKETEWKSGINLLTFLILDGVFPNLITICDELLVWSTIPLNDFTLWNLVIRGNYLHAIDRDDERWYMDQIICLTYALECLEDYENTPAAKRLDLFSAYYSKLQKIVQFPKKKQ